MSIYPASSSSSSSSYRASYEDKSKREIEKDEKIIQEAFYNKLAEVYLLYNLSGSIADKEKAIKIAILNLINESRAENGGYKIHYQEEKEIMTASGKRRSENVQFSVIFKHDYCPAVYKDIFAIFDQLKIKFTPFFENSNKEELLENIISIIIGDEDLINKFDEGQKRVLIEQIFPTLKSIAKFVITRNTFPEFEEKIKQFLSIDPFSKATSMEVESSSSSSKYMDRGPTSSSTSFSRFFGAGAGASDLVGRLVDPVSSAKKEDQTKKRTFEHMKKLYDHTPISSFSLFSIFAARKDDKLQPEDLINTFRQRVTDEIIKIIKEDEAERESFADQESNIFVGYTAIALINWILEKDTIQDGYKLIGDKILRQGNCPEALEEKDKDIYKRLFGLVDNIYHALLRCNTAQKMYIRAKVFDSPAEVIIDEDKKEKKLALDIFLEKLKEEDSTVKYTEKNLNEIVASIGRLASQMTQLKTFGEGFGKIVKNNVEKKLREEFKIELYE